MTLRLLRHGVTGCVETCDLRAGVWSDVAVQGQFLIDLEFLLNCAPSAGTASCVYCKSPSYLRELAQQFPWIHFFAYEHEFPVPDYDPAEPALTDCTPPTVQIEYNRTMCATEFTKDMARTMGDRGQRERESLLLICHGVDAMRQLAIQVLMRAQWSLLDIPGSIPAEYVDGDIVFPMFIEQDRLFSCIAVKSDAKGRTYDPDMYGREMGEARAGVRFGKNRGMTLVRWQVSSSA